MEEAKTDLAKKFDATLKSLGKKDQGLSLHELSRRLKRKGLKISAQFLSMWRRGLRSNDPSLDVTSALFQELGYSPKESVTLSTGCGNLTLRETIKLSPENVNEIQIDKYREFINLMKTKKFTEAQWNDILKIAKK